MLAGSAVQLNVAPELSAHVAMALEFHLRRCREQGVPVPEGLVDLQDWALVVARGLTAPSPVPDTEDAGVKVLLTLPDVGEQLGCSLSKVKKLISDGELPVVHLAGVRRIRRVDLDAFVEHLGSGSFWDRIEEKTTA